MKTRLFFIVMLLFFLCGKIAYVSAQVTIGSDESPTHGALLQLKTVKDETSAGEMNATQGLGFPRVALVKRDQLQPMYSASEVAALSDALKKAHKGLVVYNIAEVDAEDLSLGLNFWDGEQWLTVSETQKKAVFTFNCNKIRLHGRYFRLSPLTSDNYIILPITVTKKGDYTIIASTNNGYYFQATGVFNSPGEYEVKLDGMGTPANIGDNLLNFTNNGEQIQSDCNYKITVQSSVLTYRIIDCDNIKVMGDYRTRQETNAFNNFIEIPVEIVIDGTTTWETEKINGVKFVAKQAFTAPGETVLVAKAEGVPAKSGKYTYRIITDGAIRNQCSFEIEVTSTLGTYNDPACKCLDIYEERPDITNGEYFLVDCEDADATIPVKTFCDIANGGYTLVWSFTEQTAYDTYSTAANGLVMGASWRFAMNVPRNRVTDESTAIDYTDYRLTQNEFKHFPNSISKPTLKVRICENPTDMNDEWGLNNYGIISPRSVTENPIENATLSQMRVPSVGKVFGKRWEQKATGGGDYGGWDEVGGNHRIALYSNASYPTHWDWGYTGSATLFEVYPNKGAANNKAQMHDFNNTFGWFGENGPNHHFGKCGGESASDYDFSTLRCSGTSLRPHNTINNGEGRYLQWFVK
ncbi:MAG: hypothetical protein E6772_06225 [Dysgonomonas sp.]|nr:hypothetical protein [Dysgonomonas sp.]